MELPFVARDRARSLYRAGFRSLADVANATPEDIVARVDNLHRQTARHMIAAAKVLVYDKNDALDEGDDSYLELVTTRMRPPVPLDDTFQTQNSSNESWFPECLMNVKREIQDIFGSVLICCPWC